jgi:hypothetical protein
VKFRNQAVATGVVTVLSAGILMMGSAEAAPTSIKLIRKADFIPTYSDTRPTGHYDFLREGIHVYTEGALSTDKVAEYFALGPAMPTASNLNLGPGQTAPNLVVAKVGANGRVSIYNARGSTDVVVDVAGWYGADGA